MSPSVMLSEAIRTTSENSVCSGPPLVISTKAEGRAEKSGREWTLRYTRGQMSRLRFAPLDMTNPWRHPDASRPSGPGAAAKNSAGNGTKHLACERQAGTACDGTI